LPRRILERKAVTTAEAKRIFEKIDQSELGEFQKRTMEYAMRFAKIPAAKAERLVKELMSRFQLDRKDAIQIVNCMHTVIEELRTIVATRDRVISSVQLEEMLKLVQSYKET